jgi:hypothetical protein
MVVSSAESNQGANTFAVDDLDHLDPAGEGE